MAAAGGVATGEDVGAVVAARHGDYGAFFLSFLSPKRPWSRDLIASASFCFIAHLQLQERPV